jgi:putative DNA primase/helicase
MTWDGATWRYDEAETVQRMFSDLARTCLREAADIENEGHRKAAVAHAMRLQSRNAAENALALARSFPGISAKVSDMDADPFLLGVANGVVDLRTGAFRPGQREDLITRRSPVAFDPSATCPRWKRFMVEIMLGDAELIDYLQRAIGYSFTGAMWEQVFFFLFGGGSNGKSVFLETIQSVAGEYRSKASSSLLTTGAHDHAKDPRNELAELPGVRFLTSPEVEGKCRLNEGVVKDITGGDTLRGEAKYKGGFNFRPTCKLWMFGNHKPAIDGTDRGIWRRVRLIPFAASFEGKAKDETLTETLRDELPGILNWVIAGAMTWSERGLRDVPAKVSHAVADYKESEDVLGLFLRACLRERSASSVKKRAVYERFQSWSSENGHRHPMTAIALTKALKARGWSDSDGSDYWRGWELEQSSEEEGLNY